MYNAHIVVTESVFLLLHTIDDHKLPDLSQVTPYRYLI